MMTAKAIAIRDMKLCREKNIYVVNTKETHYLNKKLGISNKKRHEKNI